MHKRTWFYSAAAAAVLLVLAGCGGAVGAKPAHPTHRAAAPYTTTSEPPAPHRIEAGTVISAEPNLDATACNLKLRTNETHVTWAYTASSGPSDSDTSCFNGDQALSYELQSDGWLQLTLRVKFTISSKLYDHSSGRCQVTFHSDGYPDDVEILGTRDKPSFGRSSDKPCASVPDDSVRYSNELQPFAGQLTAKELAPHPLRSSPR